MKIAIQGHPFRGKEVIQILKDLGGKGSLSNFGYNEKMYYWINSNDIILESLINIKTKKEFNLYTLEEFEKEFPFKVGDIVILKVTNSPYEVVALKWYMNKLCYKLDNGFHYTPEKLTTYKEMKEERNITLTLEKAKEWYKKGGDLKQVALQAFTEEELNPLPRSWEEFCDKYSRTNDKEYFIDSDSKINQVNAIVPNHCRLMNADRNICPSKESAEAHLAMIQLEQLRDCWRQGWVPNWLDDNEMKYVIIGWKDKSLVRTSSVTHSFLSFPNYILALEFQKCFKDLIEKAGDLI